MVEVVGALLYLLNKIFFLLRELAGQRNDRRAVRRWKISAWTASLIGLPFVTYILLNEHDWIFGLLELGVAPSMIVGIIRAHQHSSAPLPKWVDYIFYVAIGVGITCSVLDLGGLLSVTQSLEMTAVVTFWIGSWLLSTKDDRNGYLLYVLMFAAAGTLLTVQGHYWFALQQVASTIIILIAYRLAGSRQH